VYAISTESRRHEGKKDKEWPFTADIMYLSKQLTSLTGDIGKNFGGKDHATVIYSYSRLK
jgi:hypothetical protein